MLAVEFLLHCGEWYGFVCQLAGVHLPFSTDGLASRALLDHDYPGAASALGPPPFGIRLLAVFGSLIGFFCCGRPFCSCPPRAFILSVTQMAMDDNLGFAFLLLLEAA